MYMCCVGLLYNKEYFIFFIPATNKTSFINTILIPSKLYPIIFQSEKRLSRRTLISMILERRSVYLLELISLAKLEPLHRRKIQLHIDFRFSIPIQVYLGELFIKFNFDL